MIGQKIFWLNSALVGLAILFILTGGIFWLKRPDSIIGTQSLSKECSLPKSAFELSHESYEKMGESLLALQDAPLALHLPDLRQQLIYYGKNGRPDANSLHTLLHFSWNAGNKTVVSIPPNEKLYFIFDRKSKPGRYIFSPNNEKTSLWIEAKPVDNEVEVHLTLENDAGEKVVEPEAYANFRLPEKEFIRFGGANWEIGSFRVDGTLLARQKARWCGIDRFLEHHGGEEFKNIEGKQRIDFGENSDLYSVFVKVGDCLIWNQNRWNTVEPGTDSQGFPLIVVKKIDDRLMTLELWDVEGKGKISLNLLKASEQWAVQNPQTLQHMFKFVGARTRSQCVFEINRVRMTLKPSDWLLMTPKGWKKLETEEEIDQYVKRNLSGTLFVFEGLIRKDERQYMKGTLYSPARNESQTVELALQTKQIKPTHKEVKEVKEYRETKTGIELESAVDRDSETPRSVHTHPSAKYTNRPPP